jgi:hypothetical protein
VFENRILRTIFGPKREEVTGDGDNFIRWNSIILAYTIREVKPRG